MASTMAAYQHFGGGTVGGLLRARAAAAPDQVLLMTGSERYTYAEVAAITDYVAKGHLAMGYKQGDRVAILCGNGSRYIFAWLGGVAFNGDAVIPFVTRQYAVIRHTRA